MELAKISEAIVQALQNGVSFVEVHPTFKDDSPPFVEMMHASWQMFQFDRESCFDNPFEATTPTNSVGSPDDEEPKPTG